MVAITVSLAAPMRPDISYAETAAPPGTVPMWGQRGDFTVNVGDMPVHIVMDGLIGVSAGMNVPAFSPNVVEPDKPFLSETGYRSFIGVHANLVPGLTPDVFAREVIGSYIKGECRGKLRPVKQEYRERY